MLRSLVIVGALLAVGCSGDIYMKDGVTDGDTFYLAPHAMMNDNPVLQSWVSYSLTRSTCQLEIGGTNPARESSYGCELMARRHLLESWSEQQLEYPGIRDEYLDSLERVRAAGFLDEYVVYHFASAGWIVPADVDAAGFQTWQRQHLPGHRAMTRIIGSWNYSERVKAVLDDG